MKKVLLVVLFAFPFMAGAQTVIDSVARLNFSLDDGTGKRLADLALNNAHLRAIDKEIEFAALDIGRTQATWLDQFNASFNLNEGNLRKQTNAGPVNYFYPRYNMSLSIPLGIFFTKPKEIKMARATYDMKVAKKEEEMMNVRKQVESQYQVYQSARILLSLQELVVQDEYIIYSQAQQKFNDGATDLDKYTDAVKRYNSELAKKVTLVKDVAIARYDLENLIGIDLDKAFAYLNIQQ